MDTTHTNNGAEMMDARRMEHLQNRIEAAALREIEEELDSTATDELEIRDLAPWRAAIRILIRRVSAIHDKE